MVCFYTIQVSYLFMKYYYWKDIDGENPFLFLGIEAQNGFLIIYYYNILIFLVELHYSETSTNL